MKNPEAELTLGYITGVHGLKGWVKVHSFTDPRHGIFTYQPWLMGDDRREMTLERGQPHGKTLIARIDGIETVEAARALVDQDIRVRRDALPESEAGSWYWADLIGLRVVNRDGVELGKVQRMIETGANDVMVLTGDRERLVPFVKGVFVLEVNLEQEEILVDWHPED